MLSFPLPRGKSGCIKGVIRNSFGGSTKESAARGRLFLPRFFGLRPQVGGSALAVPGHAHRVAGEPLHAGLLERRRRRPRGSRPLGRAGGGMLRTGTLLLC